MTVLCSIFVLFCPKTFHTIAFLSSSLCFPVVYHLPSTPFRRLSIQLLLHTPKPVFFPSDPNYHAVLWAAVCLIWPPLGTSALGWIRPSTSTPSTTSSLTASPVVYLMPLRPYLSFYWTSKPGVKSPASSPSTSPGNSYYYPSCYSSGSFPVETPCS